MLEYIGFIALIALIFGISFAEALGGFLRVVLIVLAVIMSLGIVAKMIESKKGSWFVFVASIVAIVLGIIMVNDNIDSRYSICFSMTSHYSYSSCMSSALDDHNTLVNKGWGFIIVGGFIGLAALNGTGLLDSQDNGKNSRGH